MKYSMMSIEQIDKFGDVREIKYDTEARQMIAVGRVSPTDISRLLNKMSEYYTKDTSKRGKRIEELSKELSKLILKDCSFYADTHSYIANGPTIQLIPEKL